MNGQNQDSSGRNATLHNNVIPGTIFAPAKPTFLPSMAVTERSRDPEFTWNISRFRMDPGSSPG